MSATVPLLAVGGDCCNPCNDQTITSQIPGPPGAPGAPGAAGTNGVDSFTMTTASFVMPAVSGDVTVDVVDSTWMGIAQFIFIEGAGYFLVDALPDATHVTALNLGYSVNVAPTTVVASGQKVSPGGIKGTDGGAGTPPTLNDISPTTSKGDIIVDTGANNPNAADVRFGAGSDGQILTSLSSQPTGLLWQSVVPNAISDNHVARFNAAGTTTPTPLQDSAMAITDTGALQNTGGNAKGTDAVDLQPSRAVATQVASGNNSVVAGGKNNTASGATSVVSGGSGNVASGANSTVCGGENNTASGLDATVAAGSTNLASAQAAAVLAGANNTASGIASAVLSGSQNVASGQSSVACGELNTASATDAACLGGASNAASAAGAVTLGGLEASSYLVGQVAHAFGKFANVGDAQSSELLWKGSTTDATANVELFIGPGSARAVVPNNVTWCFDILLVGRKDDGTSACWRATGGIKNTGGTVVVVAAPTVTVISDGTSGTWGLVANFVVDADDPNNSLRLRVTGSVASNIRWVAKATLVEVAN